jgi:hypothetical protein
VLANSTGTSAAACEEFLKSIPVDGRLDEKTKPASTIFHVKIHTITHDFRMFFGT